MWTYERLALDDTPPKQARIIMRMQQNSELEWSAKKLADWFTEQDADGAWTVGATAYHVRQLAKLGLIRETRRVPRRGAVETFYALSRRRIPKAKLVA